MILKWLETLILARQTKWVYWVYWLTLCYLPQIFYIGEFRMLPTSAILLTLANKYLGVKQNAKYPNFWCESRFFALKIKKFKSTLMILIILYGCYNLSTAGLWPLLCHFAKQVSQWCYEVNPQSVFNLSLFNLKRL